ncbi:MAG: hypothetical protein Homavirus12_8 [Homavirus sp.]|uniref:Uncharacterized protein n=1 Tax=Homavirus sp. TaxID=2487769 RepID=A0A3G5A6Q7_9VIRU|nr:MAG: hypothetical protein Homavirus12_8 [Homavirus sp.]
MTSTFTLEIKTPAQQVADFLYKTFIGLIEGKTRDGTYIEFRTYLDKYQLVFPIDDSYKPPLNVDVDNEPIARIVFTKENTPSLEHKLKLHFDTLYHHCCNNEFDIHDVYKKFMIYLNDNHYKFPLKPVSRRDEFFALHKKEYTGDITPDEFYELTVALFTDS